MARSCLPSSSATLGISGSRQAPQGCPFSGSPHMGLGRWNQPWATPPSRSSRVGRGLQSFLPPPSSPPGLRERLGAEKAFSCRAGDPEASAARKACTQNPHTIMVSGSLVPGSVTAYPVPAASCNCLVRELQAKAAGLLHNSTHCKSPPAASLQDSRGVFFLLWPLARVGPGWARRDGATPELDGAGSCLEKPSAFRTLSDSGAVPLAWPNFPAEAPQTKQTWVGWAEVAGPGDFGCRRNVCKSPCLLLLLPKTRFLHLCLEAQHGSVHTDRAQGVQLLLTPPPWASPRVFSALSMPTFPREPPVPEPFPTLA